MKKLGILLFTIVLTGMYSCKNDRSTTQNESVEKEEEKTQRIITLSGALTETVSALGYENSLVGVDVTSTYPENVSENVQDLGHVRSLTIEPIMELKPSLILASDRDMNPELLQKLKDSEIETILFSQEYSLNGTKELIKQVAESLGEEGYQDLLDEIDSNFEQVENFETKPKVLFIYARGAGTMMVAGQNTPMQKIVELAGGEYAVSEFEDFKPLTPESLVQNNPDVIMLFNSGLQSLGGIDGLLKIQGVAQTKAGKNRAIIAVDGGLISGFGPRVGQAALELNKLLINSKK